MSKAARSRTKVRLLQAATAEFAAHGYRGTSLRDIAKLANTNVAAVKYHYESKEKLWQAVVARLYQSLGDAVLSDEKQSKANTTRELIRNSTRDYIIFSARNPELYRITVLEVIDGSERLEWLARHHLREFMERTMAWASIAQQNDVFPREIAPLNLVYVMMGATQTLFMMAPQVKRSFGIDVFDDHQIEQQVDAIMQLFRL